VEGQDGHEPTASQAPIRADQEISLKQSPWADVD